MKKNIEQEKAIAQLEGPVILISCPGSGKTTTLLRRINHMLEVGIPPKKILMITFTKAAAQEMSVKFKKKFGEPNGITFSTIHALCLKILMTYGGQTGDAKIRVIGEESPAHQMKDVSGDVKSCGYAFNESAVLYRNNRQAEQVAEKFSEEGIPYYCTEAIPDSYEHWIWYDILAYYRLSRGIAASGDFKRIADRPNRYMRLILHEAGGEQEADLLEAASRKYTDWRRDNARKIIRKYFYDIREMGKKSPRQFLDYLLKDVGYEKYLREYAESLQQDFDEMKHMLSIYQRDSQKFHTMKEWLLYIKKRSMNLNNNNDQGVCLSTMHRSKGLEWKNVYIIDCNEGYIPPGSPDTPISQEEVEEERRLFYVAVTRAKERLFITYVGNKKGKPVSRFVRELQLKESGRAKTVKKNDMVRHKTYGVCMVLSVNGNKCTIRSLSDDRDAEVLVSSLDIR